MVAMLRASLRSLAWAERPRSLPLLPMRLSMRVSMRAESLLRAVKRLSCACRVPLSRSPTLVLAAAELLLAAVAWLR
jgi:hypothetical protein